MRFAVLVLVFVFVCGLVLPRPVYAVDHVYIEDTYDDGRCSNCTTNSIAVNGTLALLSENGFVVYSAHPLDHIEEVFVSTTIIAYNRSAVALWLSPAYSVNQIPGINIEHRMIGPGISILIDFETCIMYILSTNVQGIVYPSIMATVDISGYVHRGRNYTAVYLFATYSMVTNRSAYLEVSTGGTKVYSSDAVHGQIPFFEPRFIYIIGSGGTNYSAYIDYTAIRFSRYSARGAVGIGIEVEPIVLPSAVTIWRHNSTHIVISYTCYYTNSVDECEAINITIRSGSNNTVYQTSINSGLLTEIFKGVAVFRDFVPVVNGTLLYTVCTASSGCTAGSIQMDIDEPLKTGDNQYAVYIATAIPFATVVALAARTSNMKMAGAGLIAAGIAVLLLPWIMIVPQSIYTVSMVLISLGIVVLILYRE